jgi:DNA-3-methyladenine glycosylase II
MESMVERWVKSLGFPLDWKLKLRFNPLPARPTPCFVKGDEWFRACRLKGRLIPVRVKCLGSIEKPKLEVSTLKISSDMKKKLENLIFAIHGLKDYGELYEFMDKDRVLKKIKAELYGFGRAGLMAVTVFEGLVKSIIQQQISLRIAQIITANLVEKFGEHLEFLGEKVYDFPSAEVLASAKIEKLRGCGLSWRKAEYIRDLAVKVSSGEFNPESLRRLKPKEIIEVLTGFRGFGRWTAELVMITVMGFNVIPADDLGVRKAVSHFYFKGELQPSDVVRKFAEQKFGRFLRDIIVYLLMAYRMGLKL